MTALTSEQTMALLDKLSRDDGYRELFSTNLAAALAQLPGKPEIPPGTVPGSCLQPKQLVSKEAIAASLQALHGRMMGAESQVPKLLEA